MPDVRRDKCCLSVIRWTIVAILVAGVSGCDSNRGDPQQNDSDSATLTTDKPPVPVTVAAVEIQSVQRRVSVVGSLFGFEQVTVTPKVEGRVVATRFEVGDRVAPGTTLLELDSTDYQLSVDEAQRLLEQQLTQLDLVEPPAAEFDIEQLPSVQSARLLRESAVRHYDRQKKLHETRAGVEQSLEQAETDLKIADAKVRQSRIDARTSIAATKHRESQLSLARQKLSETIVKAPALNLAADLQQPAEFVVSKRMISVGEMVRAFPSTPVFELIVDNVLKLHVMVPERYLSQVRMGLDVEIYVEAYPAEMFPGKVARISPTINQQSRSFDVEAHVPNQHHRLRHGGFAKVDIILGNTDAAVTVPLESVTRFAGVSKVFRVRDGSAEEVQVTTGTQGTGWVEVQGDLKSGDLVVTSGQSKLSNGTHVTIRQPGKTLVKGP